MARKLSHDIDDLVSSEYIMLGVGRRGRQTLEPGVTMCNWKHKWAWWTLASLPSGWCQKLGTWKHALILPSPGFRDQLGGCYVALVQEPRVPFGRRARRRDGCSDSTIISRVCENSPTALYSWLADEESKPYPSLPLPPQNNPPL